MRIPCVLANLAEPHERLFEGGKSNIVTRCGDGKAEEDYNPWKAHATCANAPYCTLKEPNACDGSFANDFNDLG